MCFTVARELFLLSNRIHLRIVPVDLKRLKFIVAAETNRENAVANYNNCHSIVGLPPYEIDTPPESPKLTSQTPVSRQKKPMKPVSYDDYHVLWKGIATSITKYECNNGCKLFNWPASLLKLTLIVSYMSIILQCAVMRLLETDTNLGRAHNKARSQLKTLDTKLEQLSIHTMSCTYRMYTGF